MSPKVRTFLTPKGKWPRHSFFLFHADGGALPTQNLFPMLEIRSQHFPEYAVSKVPPSFVDSIYYVWCGHSLLPPYFHVLILFWDWVVIPLFNFFFPFTVFVFFTLLFLCTGTWHVSRHLRWKTARGDTTTAHWLQFSECKCTECQLRLKTAAFRKRMEVWL